MGAIGDPHDGLERGKLAFRLDGERLRVRWALIRMRGDRKDKRENWLLVKELDEEVDRERDVLEEYETSVASGRDLDGIAERPRVWNSGERAAKARNGTARKPRSRGAGARFLGLREDKPASAVVWQEPQPVEEATMPRDSSGSTIAGVKLSHPDKVLYADQGITKRDLATYLEKVAKLMLPQLENRLVSFVRCPDGRSGQCFFQRHVSPGMPASFRQLEVKESGGKREKYIYLVGIEGLIATAQFGVLEIHVWGSRIDDVERPDRIVFDLDPGEGVAFAEVKRAAEDMRDTLDALGIETVPMLTGGKGIHVIAPIVRRHAWPEVKAFCRAVAERLAEATPDRFVANMAKSRRKGRIFIDYLRNDRTATAIAPFSARARPGAPLAWPVEWHALPEVSASAAVALGDVLSGARKPAGWSRYPGRQSLKAAAFRALGVEPG